MLRLLHPCVFSSLITVLAFLCGNAVAQPYGSAGVQTAVPKSTTTAPYGYYEYLPDDYNHTSAQKFGLMIFLHGSGERGNGENELSRVASGQWPTGFIANNGRKYPVIVLSPQCSDQVGAGPAHDDCGWWNQSRIAQFVAYAKTRYNVDPKRIYATGLSMGGAGTVYAARGATADIAALVSICQAEGSNAGVDVNLVNKPMWIAHAIDDGVVGAANSWNFLNGVTAATASIMDGFDFTDSNGSAPPQIDFSQTALYNVSAATSSGTPAVGHRWIKEATINDTAINADHNIRQRLTVYRNGGHGIWNLVYNDQNIMSWLFKQRLNETPQTCNLDVNAGGAFDMKDARAVISWMLGFRGTVLENAAGFNGVNATAINQFLTAQQTNGALDLDGDGVTSSITDGLMLLRIALGFTDGTVITNRAINAAGTRGTWAGVRAHLLGSCKLTLP